MRLLVGASIALIACADAPTAPLPPPEILEAQVDGNPANVLSAIVLTRVRGADSVAVQYGMIDGGEAGLAPATAAAESSLELPVLGLFPERRYRFRVVAHGAGGVAIGPALEFTTGSLPVDLPRYTAGGPDPSPGFVVFAAGVYGLVIDNTGRVVWYHRFPDPGPGLSFVAQPTGRFAARPPASDPSLRPQWVEIDPLGRTGRTLGCQGGLAPRFHDLLAVPDGSYWLLCDESRVLDLSALGGSSAAVVTATAVQHLGPEGSLLFHWTPFDHFDIAEADPAELQKEAVNWTHGNALDVDSEGHVLVSFRNLGEVTRIDGRTGAVLWRLGGAANQFAIEGADPPPFAGQHSVRAAPDGGLLLLDNIGDPLQSRAERYSVLPSTRVARLTAAAGAGVTTVIGGSVQSLPGNRTLVSFGTAGRVVEYDEAGRVVWRIEGNAGYVFRAQRIASLYAPGVGTSR